VVRSASTRRDRKFWERAVATAEAGELSHADVAARFGVRVRTLRSWIYRLRRERRTAPVPQVRLLPVEVTPSPPAAALIVRVGDVVLEVPTGTAPAYVAALITALRAA
jgi:transposase-like protein